MHRPVYISAPITGHDMTIGEAFQAKHFAEQEFIHPKSLQFHVLVMELRQRVVRPYQGTLIVGVGAWAVQSGTDERTHQAWLG